MNENSNLIEISWGGPFSWPGFESENKLHSIPKISGVYLMTFEHKAGFLIYAAGLTRRPALVRFREHTFKYMNGDYNVLDVDAAQQGVRKEIWHGWGYAREHREEFEERKIAIQEAVRKQLAGFCIFVANFKEDTRVLERLEFSIMNNLYQQLPPICELPDRGMQLSSRWDTELPIIIKNYCKSILYGLPTLLEI